MESFLAVDWKNYGSSAKLVPTDFILGPLIKALNDPVQHKDFGLLVSASAYSFNSLSSSFFFFLSMSGVTQSICMHLSSEIGSKEVYSSWAVKAAARFLFEYASVLDERFAVNT